MTSYGRINLISMIAMPVLAMVAAAITPALDRPYLATFVTVFVINLIVMLIGGLGTALMIRGARRRGVPASPVVLLPSLVPAIVGSAWYLFRAIEPEAVAPGAEFLAVPQYLLPVALALWLGCWIASRTVVSRRPA
jgi:hypothetical protein